MIEKNAVPILAVAATWVTALLIYLGLNNSWLIFALAAALTCVILAAVCFPAKFNFLTEYFIRHRWAIALLAFCLCVCFRISGSSIGMYNSVLPTQSNAEQTTLFGEPRCIRSDEYGVQTQKYFSQSYNGFSLYSRQMSLSETNMVLDYFSPVWDITAVGKPLMWGYLLFGNEVGLSWYWCGLIILLFMLSFEMLLILTDYNRWVSILGGIMIVLSPAIQWWVLPHMPIVVMYAMALFCVGYKLFTVETVAGRWIFSALALISALGFALSIFPSFQVPYAYIIIALLVICLIRDRSKISFRQKDWYFIAIPAVLALAVLVSFVLRSKDDFALLMNTVYPGSRVCAGGEGNIRDIFTDLTSVFLPYKDITYLNNCEVSSYIHFAPFFIVLFPRLYLCLKKENSRDLIIGTALFAILLLLILFICVGIPEFLSKITLLKYCNRMKTVYGWGATVFTIWGIAVLAERPALLKTWEKLVYPVLYGIACVLLLNDDILGYFASFGTFRGLSLGTIFLAVSIAAFVALLLLLTFCQKRLLTLGVCVIMALAGLSVNPVEIGIGSITNHPISQRITEISQGDPKSLWLCTDCAFYMSNYVMANGARVLNATNFYPDTEKWRTIDPEGTYDEIINRYANQSTTIAEGASNFTLASPDYIIYSLPPETIKDLGVRYLFSATDYTELLEKHGITCALLMSQDGYSIFSLTY